MAPLCHCMQLLSFFYVCVYAATWLEGVFRDEYNKYYITLDRINSIKLYMSLTAITVYVCDGTPGVAPNK